MFCPGGRNEVSFIRQLRVDGLSKLREDEFRRGDADDAVSTVGIERGDAISFTSASRGFWRGGYH